MTYKLAINKNEDYNSRTGIITIKQTESGRTVNVIVNQEGTDNYIFSVTPVTAVMNADGSTTINATVTSIKNDAAQGFSLNNKSDWLNVTINDGTVTITAEQYTGSDLYRSGSVSFIQNESGRLCGIDITQSYPNKFEIIDTSIQNVDYNRLETSIGVVSIVNRQPADFTVESISADWVTANPVSVAGNKRLHVVISKNVDSNPRTCTITCKQTDTGAIATTTITQARGPYDLSVEPTTINTSGEADNKNIVVTSTVDGTDTAVEIVSKPDWITVTQE